MGRRHLGRAILVLLASGGPALAQMTEPLFRSWEADVEPFSARAAGLAGALVAEPDDAATALLHPAGLSLVSGASGSVSARYAGSGGVALDASAARWSLAEIAVAIPVGLHWGVGAYHHGTRRLELSLDPAPLPDGSIDTGGLTVDQHETGVAVGYAVAPMWRLGARLGLARLSLDGSATTTMAAAMRSATTSTSEDRLRFAAGFLFAPEQRFQAGVTWQSGIAWKSTLTTPEGTSPWQQTDPARLSIGVVYRPSSVAKFLVQADVVDWSAVSDALRAAPGRPAPEPFSLEDATELRAGLELLPHYGEIGVWRRPALRLGWRLRSRGLLEYQAEDEVERARFPGADRSHEFSLGIALGRVELAWVSREPADTWLFGVRHAF